MINKYNLRRNTSQWLGDLMIIAVLSFAVWLTFWFANGIVWLSSLIPGVESFISTIASKEGSTFTRAIVYIFIDFEWLYGAAFLLVLLILKPEDNKTIDSFEVRIYIILAILVILVYDARIAPLLPHFLEAPIVWLQTTCNARLVGGATWGEDYSGNITDPVYYSVFDLEPVP